jgi:hypothetical protein
MELAGRGAGGRTYILIVERYFYAGADLPLPAGISDIEQLLLITQGWRIKNRSWHCGEDDGAGSSHIWFGISAT